jgi:mevalonate kinase
MTHASAPAKIILFGEHAVVYGRPAVAVPVEQRRATVIVEPGTGSGVHIRSGATGEDLWLHEAADEQPLAQAVRLALSAAGQQGQPSLDILIDSNIPIAAGLGSGAAVTVAVLRAVSAHFGVDLKPARQSDLAYQVEVLHHGTPSGIDNTVVAFGQPVYFVRGEPPALMSVGTAFRLVIADSGVPSKTGPAVAGVRERWQADSPRYDQLFDRIGAIAELARPLVESGDPAELGPLMDENHTLLKEIGVSNEGLDRLAAAARTAGALGAKLSGAGLGGNVVCLVPNGQADNVIRILLDAGAVSAFVTEVRA